ncbi:MAG: nickel pincer cofactor biosynthesis protein LarC2 [Candidatus Hermodarchaeia archaeon]|jgi:uncharacterized protein (DUF111 family)
MLIVAALDDVSGETVAYVIDKLLEKGANNVHVSQTVTKKGRPGLLFFIDVDEENLEIISEVIMTQLGSTGYNVIDTTHVHTDNKVSKRKVIIRSKQESFEDTVSITSSYSSKGKLVKINPESEDLVKIIKRVNKKFGIHLTFRELKKKIQNETGLRRGDIILELPF